MKVSILQTQPKNCTDSFFYDGDIALFTHKDREAMLIACGEIRIVNPDDELVYDGTTKAPCRPHECSCRTTHGGKK